MIISDVVIIQRYVCDQVKIVCTLEITIGHL